MSALFKLAPPVTTGFKLPGVEGGVEGWRKAIAVGGEGGGGGKQQPPLSPSRFAEQLRRRRFTNGKSECEMVSKLYANTLRDGFGARERLAYGSCGWGNAEVKELAATLREVAAPEVVELELKGNKELTSLAALGAAVGGGALASLRTLNLTRCFKLASLPAELASLSSLRTLDLDECLALTCMPDLSGLPQLKVKGLPSHLKAWEAGGRKAYDLRDEDHFPPETTETKMPEGTLVLPGWLCRHAALETARIVRL